MNYCKYKKIDNFDELSNDILTYQNFNDAVILPNRNYGPSFGVGGVIDETGEFVKDSATDENSDIHYGGAYPIEEDEINYCDKDVVYFGLFFNHWGHFLVDLVPRMWYIAKNISKGEQVYVAYIGARMTGNYLEFMNYLNGGGITLVNVSKPTRFHSVLVPCLSTGKSFYTAAYFNIFKDVVANSGYEKISHLYEGKKVYFTRGHYRRSHLKEMGEKTIETIFNKNGYVSIAPESLTLKDQIALWNSASAIACINGTIPLNLIFSLNAVKLIVCNKTSIYHRNLLRMAKINNNYPMTVVDTFYPPEDHLASELGSGPYFIYNSNDFIHFCKDNNLSNNNEGRRLYYFRSKLFLVYYRGCRYLMKVYAQLRRFLQL